MELFKPNIRRMARRNDVNGLIKAAQHEDNKIVNEAIEAIRGLTDPGVTTELIGLLESKDERIKMAAADSLSKNVKYMDKLVSELKHNEYAVHTKAIKVFGKIGEPGIPFLLEALSKEQWKSQQIYQAELALLEIGTIAEHHLITALNHESENVRTAAVNVLGKQGGAEAVEFLIGALKDESIRGIVIGALTEIGDGRAVKPIMDCLEDSNAGVRNRAAGALITLGKSESLNIIIDTLTKNLKDNDWQVRKLAVFFLGKTKSQEAVAALARVLEKDKEQVVREGAYLALRRILPEKEIRNLI